MVVERGRKCVGFVTETIREVTGMSAVCGPGAMLVVDDKDMAVRGALGGVGFQVLVIGGKIRMAVADLGAFFGQPQAR